MLVAVASILSNTQEEINPKEHQLRDVANVAGLVDEDKIRIWLEGGNGKENDCKFNCIATVR